MAYGNELVFGFTYPKFKSFFGEFRKKKIDFNDLQDYDLAEEEIIEPIRKKLKPLLLEAWKKAAKDMEWEFIKEKNDYFIYKTPLGDREFSPFKLQFFFDPHEMGEEIEDSIIGVSISGRYFPKFVDWRDPNGTITNVPIGPNPPKEITVACNRIIEAVPCFKNADVIVTMRHY
jgi:hypothetical protein